LSWASPGNQPGASKCGKVPVRGESREIEKLKNSGNEAKEYLKTKEEPSKTNPKGTQIDCLMRTLDAQFELFNVAHVSGWGLGRREKIKTALPPAGGLRRKGAQSGNLFFSQRPSRALRLCAKPVLPRGIIAHLLWRGNASGFGTARLVEIQRRGGKCKNSGNEAKEWLKTKNITFLNGANYAHFACRFAQIGR